MTPLQEAWKRVWDSRRIDGREFESALFAVVDAATQEGRHHAMESLSCLTCDYKAVGSWKHGWCRRLSFAVPAQPFGCTLHKEIGSVTVPLSEASGSVPSAAQKENNQS